MILHTLHLQKVNELKNARAEAYLESGSFYKNS